MIGLRRWDRGSRIALAPLVLTAALAAVSAVDAWRVEPGPEPRDGPPSRRLAARGEPSHRGGTDSLARFAVARNPFHPERRPPAERYRLPGERTRDAAASLGPVPRLSLQGTVVGAAEGLAALQLPDRSGRVLRVGDRILGMTLVAVERGKAVLQREDTTVVLELSGPTSAR